MQKNIGKTDRIIRIILGVALLALSVAWKCLICGIVGAILLLTGIIGWCGLYQIVGKSCCKAQK